MDNSVTLLQCATCDRYFVDEDAIRHHQDIHTALAAYEDDLQCHDGDPWVAVTFAVGDRSGGLHHGIIMGTEPSRDGSRVWIIRDTKYDQRACHGDDGLASYMNAPSEADDTRLREFAGAIDLGLDDDEVSIGEHVNARRRRWTHRDGSLDPQFTVEMTVMQATIGLMAYTAARRQAPGA